MAAIVEHGDSFGSLGNWFPLGPPHSRSRTKSAVLRDTTSAVGLTPLFYLHAPAKPQLAKLCCPRYVLVVTDLLSLAEVWNCFLVYVHSDTVQ